MFLCPIQGEMLIMLALYMIDKPIQKPQWSLGKGYVEYEQEMKRKCLKYKAVYYLHPKIIPKISQSKN